MMQHHLALTRKPDAASVSLDVVMKRKDFLGAINLCIDLSGLEDKELYLALDIDPGQWSRIRKGDAHFPPNKLNALMDLCNNEIPLTWLAHSRGKGVYMLETEAERQLRIANERVDETEKKLAYAESLLARR